MDKEFSDENLLLLLFLLLKFRKLRKSKCKKKMFVVDHQIFGYKISLKKRTTWGISSIDTRDEK